MPTYNSEYQRWVPTEQDWQEYQASAARGVAAYSPGGSMAGGPSGSGALEAAQKIAEMYAGPLPSIDELARRRSAYNLWLQTANLLGQPGNPNGTPAPPASGAAPPTVAPAAGAPVTPQAVAQTRLGVPPTQGARPPATTGAAPPSAPFGARGGTLLNRLLQSRLGI